MPQLSSRFSEPSHTAKTFFFLAVSLLKVKELQPSPRKLVRAEGDGSDLCEADARSPKLTALFPNTQLPPSFSTGS